MLSPSEQQSFLLDVSEIPTAQRSDTTGLLSRGDESFIGMHSKKNQIYYYKMPDTSGAIGITVSTLFFVIICLIGVFVGAPKDDRRG